MKFKDTGLSAFSLMLTKISNLLLKREFCVFLESKKFNRNPEASGAHFKSPQTIYANRCLAYKKYNITK